MPKYTVVSGKHTIRGSDGSNTYKRQGEIVDLSEAEAAKFPDKFKLVAVVEQAKPINPAGNPLVPPPPEGGQGGQGGQGGATPAPAPAPKK